MKDVASSDYFFHPIRKSMCILLASDRLKLFAYPKQYDLYTLSKNHTLKKIQICSRYGGNYYFTDVNEVQSKFIVIL